MQFRLLTLAVAILPVAQADDWASPVIREVFSQSRAYFVRVLPGKSLGDTVGFSGAPKGAFATAEFYRLEKDRSYRLTTTATLLNPVAPVDFLVTDSGFLMTLDNWHNRGYGKVVAFYTAEGTPIRAYELSDLFTKSEIERFEHSVSSIQWRKSTEAYVRPGGKMFHVAINDTGGAFLFERSGAYQYCETRTGSYLCRVTNQDRRWQAFREPGARAR